MKQNLGRLAVVVDNGVIGDSRVQKIATYAQKAGWEVLLLGISPTNERQEFMVDEVNVLLVPCPKYLHSFRRQNLGYSLRWLVGYPSHIRYQRAYLRLRSRKRDLEATKRETSKYRQIWRRGLFTVARLVYGVRAIGYKKGVRSMAKRDGLIEELKIRFLMLFFGNRAWQYLEPLLIDIEESLVPELEKFRPEVIHANDFRSLPAVARYVAAKRNTSNSVKFIWDAHEYLPGVSLQTARSQKGSELAELEYGIKADACVTVSSTLGNLLQSRHKLPKPPVVILNAPIIRDDGVGGQATIRELIGLPEDVPLAVYSGAVSDRRGVFDVIEALELVPEFHFAIVCPRNSAFRARIKTKAVDLGVDDRVHILDYVSFDQVSKFLSSADVGLIPLHHTLNHEVALITKYFEYVHAGLALVVSDVNQMRETTLEFNLGEVFEAQNVADLARAMLSAYTNKDLFTSSAKQNIDLSEWTWESQFEKLNHLYLSVLSS